MIIRTALLIIGAKAGAASAIAPVRALLRDFPAVVLMEESVGAQRNWVAETLRRWCDEEEIDLVLTVGGTLPAPGPSADECAPEATLDVLERLAPALPETMRAEAAADFPLALLDRGVAGIRGRTLIVNLPEGAAAPLFLAAVVDLLPAYVAHLQGEAAAPRIADGMEEPESPYEPPDEVPADNPHRTGLDPDEFAAFLRRPKPPQGQSPPG